MHIFTDNITADLYIKILNETLLPDARKIFNNSDWTLLQDNDPKHTARKVKEFLEEHKVKVIQPKEWPANSPDLNPIENIN